MNLLANQPTSQLSNSPNHQPTKTRSNSITNHWANSPSSELFDYLTHPLTLPPTHLPTKQLYQNYQGTSAQSGFKSVLPLQLLGLLPQTLTNWLTYACNLSRKYRTNRQPTGVFTHQPFGSATQKTDWLANAQTHQYPFSSFNGFH